MAIGLELPEPEIDRIRIAALLRDIGKVAVPNEILVKSSALTSSEWRAIVQHPRIAQVILEQATALREAVPLILHHHERFAGHGYPFGLRGDEIPLGARIVAIADAYDAMTSDRPYKRAIGHEAAIRELRRHAGTQFDPALVRLFGELFAFAPPAPDPEAVKLLSGTDPVPTTGSESSRPAARPRAAAARRALRAGSEPTGDRRAIDARAACRLPAPRAVVHGSVRPRRGREPRRDQPADRDPPLGRGGTGTASRPEGHEGRCQRDDASDTDPATGQGHPAGSGRAVDGDGRDQPLRSDASPTTKRSRRATAPQAAAG